MIRKLKLIGLVMVAVVAISAVASGTAQADTFTSEGNVNTVVTGNQEGTNVFTVEGSKVECTTAHFAAVGETSSPTETVVVHPEYSGCKAFTFLNATVTTTGCNYALNAAGTVTIGCTGTNKITIVGGTCEATVGSQGPLSGISYENVNGGQVKVKTNVTTVGVTKTKDGIACPLGGTGSATGSYVGNVVAEGKHAGVATPIRSEQVHTFSSEGNVNTKISGSQEGTNSLTVEGTSMECSTANFAVVGETPSPTETVTVHPEYSGCITFGFLNVTVTTTGCNYILGAGGTVTVSCKSTNKIAIAFGTCEATVASQGPLFGISYANQGGKVQVTANVTTVGVTKTKDGIACPFSGTGSATGTYAGKVIASGVNASTGVAVGIKFE
jgi:hypothetical protein